MNEEVLILSRIGPRRSPSAVLLSVVASERFWVYLVCTMAALITTYVLGKEAMWDTLDYHFYAGFSATHDRFGLDYFPAAWQAYLNPYVYAPFYLLASCGLTALGAALILGAMQSGILWLTYEIARDIVPGDPPRGRFALAACAVALAFANPVLINEIGSSFCDITTAEMVLAGWLLLLAAVRSPSAARILCAGLLLGAASALKLTNAVHAVSAAPMILFLPVGWRAKLRYGALFAVALGAAFAVVAAPWSLRLEEYFGNPLFPLFNHLFRSPYFTTSPLVDQRFIPISLGTALELPFTMVLPRGMADVEWAAPDLRYAFLLVSAALSLVVWGWRRSRATRVQPASAAQRLASRALAALGCGFLIDWVLWLSASGNGRYFIPMGCVAAVLGAALVFRLFAAYPRARNYVLLSLLAAQFFQLYAGTEYHDRLPWDGAPWFDVSIPARIAAQRALYLSVGIQSNSFLLPQLAPGSGFINLEGAYTLGPQGPNGRRIEALVSKYSPHVRILVRDPRFGADVSQSNAAFFENANDAIEPFGLRIDPADCARITVYGIASALAIKIEDAAVAPPRQSAADRYTIHLVTCGVMPYRGDTDRVALGEAAANVVFAHLEEACPALFQPRGMVTYFRGSERYGYTYVRRYTNSDLDAWVSRNKVVFQKLVGEDPEQYLGPQSLWEGQPPRVICGRTSEGDFLKVLRPTD